jgi:hypothetical protein
MKRSVTLLSFVVMLSLCVLKAQASILYAGEEKINFSPNKVQKSVSWSEGFSQTEMGLETKPLPENQSQDVWLQTHAFPIGLSWRPPSSANFMVSFDGSLEEAGQGYPSIFIRYSSDKANWSTWYAFEKTEKKTKDGLVIYQSKIWLPMSASERYRGLMREWWRTDPIWSSDEHEFCEWLIKREPDFFAKQIPFIGYVQVRMENISVQKSLTLKSMTIGYAWGVGGLQSIPKDKSRVRKNSDEKWFFAAVN